MGVTGNQGKFDHESYRTGSSENFKMIELAEEIKNIIHTLGVRKNDNILLHSTLFRFGVRSFGYRFVGHTGLCRS